MQLTTNNLEVCRVNNTLDDTSLNVCQLPRSRLYYAGGFCTPPPPFAVPRPPVLWYQNNIFFPPSPQFLPRPPEFWLVPRVVSMY